MTGSGFESSLAKVLDDAMGIAGADFGNLQLINHELDGLQIVVQRGFDDAYLRLFRLIRVTDISPCGRAFRLGRRIMISDVEADPYFTPYVAAARRAGYRAVNAIPISGRDGRVLGVLSTYFAHIHHVSQDTSHRLGLCAARAARMIERRLQEESLLEIVSGRNERFENDTGPAA